MLFTLLHLDALMQSRMFFKIFVLRSSGPLHACTLCTLVLHSLLLLYFACCHAHSYLLYLYSGVLTTCPLHYCITYTLTQLFTFTHYCAFFASCTVYIFALVCCYAHTLFALSKSCTFADMCFPCSHTHVHFVLSLALLDRVTYLHFWNHLSVLCYCTHSLWSCIHAHTHMW